MLSISTSSHGDDGSGNLTWAAHIQAMLANHYTTTAHIEQDSPKERQVKVTNSLIALSMSEEEKAMMGEMTKETTEGLTEVEKGYQLEEEKYALHQKAYVGQLSDEEESDTELDYSGYSHLGEKK